MTIRSSTGHGATALAVLVLLAARGVMGAAEPNGPPAPPAAGSTPVTVDWLGGTPPPSAAGVTWGVPWPRGTRTREQPLTVRAADGTALPTQQWPLAFWPDGSVKWSGLALAAAAGLRGPLTVTVATPPAPATPLTVSQDQDEVVVATGALVCRIGKHGQALIRSLLVDGREVGRDGRLVAVREDRSRYDQERIIREEESLSRVDAVTVEQAGPVRAVVRIDGMHVVGAAGRAWLPFTVRLQFSAGLAAIRVTHSFVFDGDAQSDFIRGLGLVFTVPFREERQNRHVRFAGDAGIWGEPVLMSPGYRDVLVAHAKDMNRAQLEGRRIPDLAALGTATAAQFATIAVWDAFKLTQPGPDGFTISKRTGAASSWLRAAEGQRARGLGFVGDVSGGLAVGVAKFWQKHPAGLEVSGATSPAATMTVWLWSPDAPAMDLRHYDTIGHDGAISYEDHEEGFSTPYGVANTAELMLWATAAVPDAATLSAMAATANEPPLLVCAPQYYHDVPAFGAWSLPDRSTPQHAEIEDQLERAWNFYAHEVEQRRWYGFWDYGDVMRTYDPLRHRWQYDIGGHAWNNTELMADVWLWHEFLRTGRADAFRLAEAMTRNTSEVDVYHLGRFAGIGSRHNVSHWGCGAKELRISEALLKRYYHYLTADERTGDLMRETLDVDERLPNALPLRKRTPRPDVPVFIRSGPDWTALASDWYTEWERTGDVRYRDRVLAGMTSIGAMPEAFATRMAFGFDPLTKALRDVGEPNLKAGEFITLFGGDQIVYELLQSIDCPAFAHAWNAVLEGWARKDPDQSYTGTRAAAAMAQVLHDDGLARKAWNQMLRSLTVDGHPRWPATPVVVDGPQLPAPVTEIPRVDTPGTAQWALTLIIGMEFLRGFPAPVGGPGQ
jgi:hypothetical protein